MYFCINKSPQTQPLEMTFVISVSAGQGCASDSDGWLWLRVSRKVAVEMSGRPEGRLTTGGLSSCHVGLQEAARVSSQRGSWFLPEQVTKGRGGGKYCFTVSSSTFSGRSIKELVDGFLTSVSPEVRCECGVHREAVGEPVGGGEGVAAQGPDLPRGGEPRGHICSSKSRSVCLGSEVDP